MPKVYVCETCGRDVDADGYDRYRFQRGHEQADEVKQHMEDNPDHLVCELVALNG